MSIFDALKGFFSTPISAPLQPKQAETIKKSVEFDATYKPLDFYGLPVRPGNGIPGSEFFKSIWNIGPTQQRDNLILQECLNGNMPGWLRNFKPITVEEKGNKLTYFVAPDVLCVGNDVDYVRVCLNGYTAQTVCNSFNCILPTKKIADQIFLNADLKLMPTSMGANFSMITTKTLYDHNSIIEKQRNGRNFTLITGHKKDIVYSKHLLVDRSRLAIYGWFMPHPTNGRAVQAIQGPTPNATSHDVLYQDYSQSVRLISRTAMLNGQPVDLHKVLLDRDLCYLISDEGPLDVAKMYIK